MNCEKYKIKKKFKMLSNNLFINKTTKHKNDKTTKSQG